MNIPVKHGEIWIEELDDGRFTCAEVQVAHEDLEEETIKAKDVKYVILGDIQDMGRARFVRMMKRKECKEVDRSKRRGTLLEAWLKGEVSPEELSEIIKIKLEGRE